MRWVIISIAEGGLKHHWSNDSGLTNTPIRAVRDSDRDVCLYKRLAFCGDHLIVSTARSSTVQIEEQCNSYTDLV